MKRAGDFKPFLIIIAGAILVFGIIIIKSLISILSH